MGRITGINMNKFWNHFKTVIRHKYLVMQGCFRVGLYWQGLVHDLSKFGPSEFPIGVRYWQGSRSPNDAEREDKGYSSAWLHHKGRNKHHYEYWIDYSAHSIPGSFAPAPIPVRYVVEMLMDRIAACKVYHGAAYTDRDALAYYKSSGTPPLLHPKTRRQLEILLRMLAERGEKETFAYIRTKILGRRK